MLESDYISDIILPNDVTKTSLGLNDVNTIQVGNRYGTGDMYDPLGMFERDPRGYVTGTIRNLDEDRQVEMMDVPSILDYSNKLVFLLSNASKAGLLFDI
jgi:hypothetical protein